MNSGGIAKHLFLAFSAALALYVVGYSLDAHLRTHKGPWAVSFAASTNGTPTLTLTQEKLGVTNLKITFPGEHVVLTNATLVRFDAPAKAVPFGECIFDDLMYLPGTVTLQVFGHEIELLPRTLIVNKQERPWKSDVTIELTAAEKLPPQPAPKKPYRR